MVVDMEKALHERRNPGGDLRLIKAKFHRTYPGPEDLVEKSFDLRRRREQGIPYMWAEFES